MTRFSHYALRIAHYALFLAIFLTSTVAFAAYEDNVEDDADLSIVKKIAVAFPNYYKMEEKEPTIDEFARDVYEAGKLHSEREILSYDEVAAAIRRDTGVDIYQLDVVEAEKIFNTNIAKYADAYMIATVANNSGRPWLFFYVYNAANQNLLYTYSVQSSTIGKNAKDYQKAAEGFYKQLDTAAMEKLSKEEKKKLNEKKKEAKASKRKIKKVTYKTGKSKADLVKKK